MVENDTSKIKTPIHFNVSNRLLDFYYEFLSILECLFHYKLLFGVFF